MSPTKLTTRVRLVATPAPTSPRAGNPSFPKISTQLNMTLKTFAMRMTQSAGRTSSRPCRYWRIALYTKKNGIPGIFATA